MNKLSTVKLLSGNKMPQLGMGTWQMDDTAETVTHALETGYRLIDTSSDYNTQPGIGEAIKNSKVDKADIFVTTKVEETDDAYKRTLSNLEELGVNQVDLILIHRPPKSGAGEQLWKGLIKAKGEGLVKDIGVSNYSIEQMEKLFETSGEIPVVNQVEWSPFGYGSEMKKYCDKNKIVIQACSPLTRKNGLMKRCVLKLQKITVKPRRRSCFAGVSKWEPFLFLRLIRKDTWKRIWIFLILK